ncbi:peptidase [Kangiella profundi]|uniref:Peptidase n=1 Tax=Kangiella profundi TaxID=1561924 RepID=A0A2K9AK17_9GAMM|nr:M48 family metallopeptidase [Kangiella profundi]AUD77972.1 peptidase [Kangiella profundi]GGE91025.1 Zn-dependent protease [Kangiella profundi]
MKPLISACLILALFACATSPTGRSQLTLFPESQMAQMGASTFTSMQQSQKMDTNPGNARYVNCVVDALIPELNALAPGMRSTQWEVKVFADDAPNAFALPGGKIGVHTGMLKVAENQHQLASVIGHEVGHVWAKHSNERVSQGFLTQTGMQLAAVAAGDMTSEKQQLLGLLGVGAQVGVILPFSRKHESEADEIGLELMARAGFDPRQSVELWKNMQKAGSGSTPEFLSTHPGVDTRIRDLNSRMDRAIKIYQQAQASGKRPNCRL